MLIRTPGEEVAASPQIDAASGRGIMQKALAMWILLAAGGGGQPEVSPTQVVQSATEQVLQVVQDAEAAPAVQERRRREVQRIADRLFDFPEMARRALAVHWRDRTPQEQGEFVGVFKHLLGRAYLGKLENYAGEQIVYLGETVDGDFATVRSKIVTGRGAEIPVDYRLHLVGARWAVYDVAVQGVSFVGNYRGQFDKIIRSSSYQSLMRELRAKYAQATGHAVSGASPIPVAPVPAATTPAAVPATRTPQ
jgi:phospholipid transport system substrate-binding protein